MAARVQAKFFLGMYSYLRLTDSGLRQCTGLARHLITRLVVLTPILSRRMRCGMGKLVLLNLINF